MGLAKTFLAFGIAILLAIFIGYAVFVFYAPPAVSTSPYDICNVNYNCYNLTDPCNVPITNNSISPPDITDCQNKIFASPQYTQCENDYNTCVQNETYNSSAYIYARNTFYIIVVLALIAMITGIFLSYMEGIGSGIMGAGVLLILWALIATTQYWTTLNKYLKLFALGVVLVLLIYFGYKKIESKIKVKSKKRRN